MSSTGARRFGGRCSSRLRSFTECSGCGRQLLALVLVLTLSSFEAVHVAETTQTRPEDGPLRRARLLVVVRRPPFVGRGRHGQAEPPRELGLQDGCARVVVARDHYETVAVAQHLERAPGPGGRDEERCEACHWAAFICGPARRRRVASVSRLPTVLDTGFKPRLD